MRNQMQLPDGVHEFYFKGLIRLHLNQPAAVSWRTSVVNYLNNFPPSKRYTCTCHPTILENEEARFAQQVVMNLPNWSAERARREKEGMSPTVSIDPCIVDAVYDLWMLGIQTMGCCCGHNSMRAWVNVHPKDYSRMFELGYEQRPVEVVNKTVMGLYTFYL